MTKAIALLSGGLDSILAAKLILEQGIEVEGVYFWSAFFSKSDEATAVKPRSALAGKLGIKLTVFDISEELLPIVKNPPHGYGSNINPCIDCHMFMFKRAAQYMRTIGASFLVTGEVLGERPMSQRKGALDIINRESGLDGLIVRPLSAKLLEPTIPEQQGVVDRERLLAISGRGRHEQIALARKYGIENYPNPAGGCLLTDPGFTRRMKDLMAHTSDFTVGDVRLLKVGRHFRFSPQAKLVVGRDEKENERLMALAGDGDWLFSPTAAAGPTALGRGIFGSEQLAQACGIVAWYCDKEQASTIEVSSRHIPELPGNRTNAEPCSEEILKASMI